jgi:hypothetical protein
MKVDNKKLLEIFSDFENICLITVALKVAKKHLDLPFDVSNKIDSLVYEIENSYKEGK